MYSSGKREYAGEPGGKRIPHGSLVGNPKQHPLKKHPILAIAYPKDAPGANISRSLSEEILLILANTNTPSTASKNPPKNAIPPFRTAKISSGLCLK